MNVLIVGRTRMGNSSRRCIGGLAQGGQSVRLLSAAGDHWDASVPFQVGQIWDVTFAPVANLVPPHVEDMLVSQYTYVGTQANLRAYLLTQIQPWAGGTNQLFGGVLGYTGNNNGYVSESLGVPERSTWFWTPDRDLSLRSDGKHYDYPGTFSPRGLTYVGEDAPPPILPAGTLIRVSLARWWKPEDVDMEERCYLQLSGWYV